MIKSFGTKLSGGFGITGILISRFSESDLRSQIIFANQRKIQNPYHSIVIVTNEHNLPELERIVEDSNVSRQVVQVRGPMSFEVNDLIE